MTKHVSELFYAFDELKKLIAELIKARDSIEMEFNDINAMLIIIYAPYDIEGSDWLVSVRNYGNYSQALNTFTETPCFGSWLIDLSYMTIDKKLYVIEEGIRKFECEIGNK